VSTRLPTGSDVARLAGVSKSAVSRAFSGGAVSDEARERIMDAARTLKWRPNRTARSLTTSQSKLIGLAITHLDNQFYPEVVQRLHERLRQAGYRMVLFITHGEADLDPVMDELLGYRLDGIILASSSSAARVAAECQETGVPVVMFNNIDARCQVSGVCADNAAGAAQVARFFVAAGHRRIGLISGLEETSSSIERSAAFATALAAFPGVELARESGEYSFEGTVRATRALLSRRDAPDALFCVNDHMAIAALQTARGIGLEPGRNISIAGFDNVPIASWPAFQLTSYAQPLDTMIEAMIACLLDQMRGPLAAPMIARLPGQLIVRASTRWPHDVRATGPGEGVWTG
jgi:DNA-binding LacI/PurR family transcriptional regulator